MSRALVVPIDAVIRPPEMPPLLLVGVDHHSAPVELRERVSCSSEAADLLAAGLAELAEIDEVAILSTCNRTEVYVLPGEGHDPFREVLRRVFLERAPEIGEEGRYFVHRGGEAVRHLFEVAAGLQSMVLGEPEILGQVKQATARSEAAGSAGLVLQRLLRAAIDAGGRVRRDSRVGSGAVSFGYCVVELAQSIFRKLETTRVLVLGAGETARQVARDLTDKGARELCVSNRTASRGEELAAMFPGARTLPWEDRFTRLGDFDVVVASTGSREPVLSRGDFERSLRSRNRRPQLAVDLGVPRNLDADASGLSNLFLQDIDSLQVLIDRSLRKRRDEVPKVQTILDREMSRFADWYRGAHAEPIVAALQKHAERLRQSELDAVRDRFPEETHDDLDRLTRTLVRKILHHPSVQLRNGEGDRARLDFVRRLFHLDDDSARD